MEVHCDKCKKDFKVKVRTKWLDKDVEEVFFNCPNCHERYTAYYINDKIRKMQKQPKLYRRMIEKEMNKLEEIYSTQ